MIKYQIWKFDTVLFVKYFLNHCVYLYVVINHIYS